MGFVIGLYAVASEPGWKLEALAWGKWGRVFVVVGMLGFLALASQAAAQRRAVRLEALARTRAKVEASPEGAQLLSNEVLNAHLLGLKVSIKPCLPEDQ